MTKLAVIFIGTGNYINFLPTWYESCVKYLTPSTEKKYFVFTDGELNGTPNDIIPYYQEHLPWPHITLRRWETVLSAKDLLNEFDYILFLDADMRVVDKVLEEDIFTDKKYIGVHHPCHFLGMEPHIQYPGAFEINPKSCAAISPDDDVSTYWQGCLWGGKVPYVIGMIEELDRRTKRDESNDIIAVWHDESQLNKFFVEHKSEVYTLTSDYAYPEMFSSYCTFDPKIVHLAKNNSKYHV